MEACVFCKIVQKKMPASVVSDAPEWMSFNDINPQAPVHIVLVPKKHASNLSELAPDDGRLMAGLLREAERIAREKKLTAGYRIVLTDDLAARMIHPERSVR